MTTTQTDVRTNVVVFEGTHSECEAFADKIRSTDDAWIVIRYRADSGWQVTITDWA